jgi:hypothetical protein
MLGRLMIPAGRTTRARRGAGPVTRPDLLAYLSHSYRPGDRDTNLFFWELFSRAGFFFSVDPRSDLLSPAYLERSMQDSQCFVGIVTFRDNEPRIRCSPFVVFEYGLALQARKPTLLLVDDRVPGAQFPLSPGVSVQSFKPGRLELERAKFQAAIQTLAQAVRAMGPATSRPKGPVGLLVHGTAAGKRVYSGKVLRALEREVEPFYDQPRVLDLEFRRVADFCRVLQECELLIVETRDGLLPGWALGFVMGRFIPTIRLFHTGGAGARSALPPLVERYVQSGPVSDLAPAIAWSDPASLARELRSHLLKFHSERIDLDAPDAGEKYFRSIGRPAAKLFISNSGKANDTASPLAGRCRLWNIDAFHYREPGAIPARADWLAVLQNRVNGCDVFVALIDSAYWSSPYCRLEWRGALAREKRGQCAVFTYLLDRSPPPRGLSRQQAVPLQKLSPDQRARYIVEEIDAFLRSKADAGAPATSRH